jgi:hypothetical protein
MLIQSTKFRQNPSRNRNKKKEDIHAESFHNASILSSSWKEHYIQTKKEIRLNVLWRQKWSQRICLAGLRYLLQHTRTSPYQPQFVVTGYLSSQNTKAKSITYVLLQ